MAGGTERIVYINGYQWIECHGTSRTGVTYDPQEVEKLGGNPHEVRERATRYAGNEISRSNTA